MFFFSFHPFKDHTFLSAQSLHQSKKKKIKEIHPNLSEFYYNLIIFDIACQNAVFTFQILFQIPFIYKSYISTTVSFLLACMLGIPRALFNNVCSFRHFVFQPIHLLNFVFFSLPLGPLFVPRRGTRLLVVC